MGVVLVHVVATEQDARELTDHLDHDFGRHATLPTPRSIELYYDFTLGTRHNGFPHLWGVYIDRKGYWSSAHISPAVTAVITLTGNNRWLCASVGQRRLFSGIAGDEYLVVFRLVRCRRKPTLAV